MQVLRTVDQVIDKFGSLGTVAEITARKDIRVVSNWKARRRFPADTFLVLTDALTKRNLTAPSTLWGIPVAAPKRNGRASAEPAQARRKRGRR